MKLSEIPALVQWLAGPSSAAAPRNRSAFSASIVGFGTGAFGELHPYVAIGYATRLADLEIREGAGICGTNVRSLTMRGGYVTGVRNSASDSFESRATRPARPASISFTEWRMELSTQAPEESPWGALRACLARRRHVARRLQLANPGLDEEGAMRGLITGKDVHAV